MTELRCPICERALGKNELLTVGHDAKGTLWVRHFIPGDVPSREYEAPEEFAKTIDQYELDISYNNIRAYCGRAGFKGVAFK